MKKKDEHARQELIESVVRQIRERLPAGTAAKVEIFARQYYANVAPEDLCERSADDLYGAALCHFKFVTHRGEPTKLRAYNPRIEEHGWQSTHTIVEFIQDDMPFLVDSITLEVNRQGLTPHLIIHPVIRCSRDNSGRLVEIAADRRNGEGQFESLIHLEVDRRTEPADLEALETGLQRVLDDVRAAVIDWRKMQHALLEAVADIEQSPPPPEAGDTAEDIAFLQWAATNHFIFLGFREYRLLLQDDGYQLTAVPGSGLGILASEPDGPSAGFASLPAEIRARARHPRLLVLTKSNTRSIVHRPGHLDYIGIKRYDAAGEVIGERRFLGLYTSSAYHAMPLDIPLLRRKVGAVLARAGFLPKSHSAKALLTILQQYPRDELFQIEADELYDVAMGILRLGERQRTRLFVRRDPFGRFFSCLIYTPREHYDTELRKRFQSILMEAFHGQGSEFEVNLAESALARVLIVVRTQVGSWPEYDIDDLEERLVQAARRWQDDLHAALLESAGEERGNMLFARYGNAFPAGYREEHAVREAVQDIGLMESLTDASHLALSLYLPLEAPPGHLRFKILHKGDAVPLTTSLPMLEHMGVRVMEDRPYEIELAGDKPVWIHDFGMSADTPGEIRIDRLRDLFQETFLRVWQGEVENDDFNRLVLRADLGWHEVSLLRAYSKYLQQVGVTFSQTYMQQALATYPKLAWQLVELFYARFDPSAGLDHAEREQAIARSIESGFDSVVNLDEDRILRCFLALIQATVRTNYFQHKPGGKHKGWLSFKFDPAKVPHLPQPKPLWEIFVYSPRVEAVHLRGGKVARGGLRWSDRMEDFRTEVLGLMKAQMVKNAVIVPVGSKGGFVMKNPPPGGDRDALLKEGIACYQIFLRGLLDITDNLVGGKVKAPPNVVRHDDDDPYLVVAADKGTASFSDYANAVSHEYGFWLGDAFASGGSAGYDHKKMAITARGAWESVKRHFRELGRDIQNEAFTVIGIGDMSGDVFGNGMLLSKHIRLIAAFDHRHIFIDPDPDAAASFAERRRLFELPRSSWADYNRERISTGGGVWPRSAKSIRLSAAAMAALDITTEVMTPQDLIRAILLAPADLLYNGGIGTYVKAAAETHAEVGDRANDGIRVDGAELRVKVVGEGGNLGLTQRGRIEFALKGGRLYTDAIDNSGGVDCSDHEVNIKILLNSVVAEGELTPKQRDRLLAEMTDEVAALVLRDNYLQTQVISVTRARGLELLDKQARYLRQLGHSGQLNRKIEFLPFDEDIAERKARHVGLVAPEAAVLLAYSKMELYQAVLASDVPEDPYVATALERYFPKPLRERFAEPILRHALRREIIATHVVNSMINRVGSSFVFRVREESGAEAPDVVRGYLAAREVFGLVPFWQQVEALDNQVANDTQTGLIVAAQPLLLHGTLWFLRHRAYLRDLNEAVARFARPIAVLAAEFYTVVSPGYRERLELEATRLGELGVPTELARQAACINELHSALDIAEIATEVNQPPAFAAETYYALDGLLNVHWLWEQVSALPADTRWQGLARATMLDDIATQMRDLTVSAFRIEGAKAGATGLIDAWQARQAGQLTHWQQLLGEMQAAGSVDNAMLSVALRELRSLAPAP